MDFDWTLLDYNPPSIAERCLGTQFISSIAAPLFKKAWLTARLASSVRPGADSESSA
jgi:hypothetical protein